MKNSLAHKLHEKFGFDAFQYVGTGGKEKFDYDVSAMPAFVQEALPNIIGDIIGESKYLSRFSLEEGIKGSRRITLMNTTVTIQEKDGCSLTPDGAVTFTNKVITVVLLGSAIEFCNEDLNAKTTELLNNLGLKRQNGQLPAELETLLLMDLSKKLQKKIQRIFVLGDTTSSDPELALMDGLRKKLLAGATAVTTPQTAITDSNAYDLVKLMAQAVDAEVLDNGFVYEVHTGRDVMQKMLNDWNAANPYNQVTEPMESGAVEIQIPLTPIKLVVVPELTGTNQIFGVIPRFGFVGTEELSDFEFDIKYDSYNDKLKTEAAFRLGAQLVFESKMRKLVLAT